MPISFKVLSGEMKINRKMAEDMKGETEISEYNPVSLARAYGVRKREYGFWEKTKNLFIKILAILFLIFLLIVPAIGIVAFILFGNILVNTLFISIVLFVTAHILAKPIRKRAVFYGRLKKTCRERGYKLRFERGFWESLFWSRDKIDITVNTGSITYSVHCLCVRRYYSTLTFADETSFYVSKRPLPNVFTAIFDLKPKKKSYQVSFPSVYTIGEHKAVNVIVVNPVCGEWFVKNRDGASEIAGNGETCFGYTAYSGSGFISDIVRKEEQKNIDN